MGRIDIASTKGLQELPVHRIVNTLKMKNLQSGFQKILILPDIENLKGIHAAKLTRLALPLSDRSQSLFNKALAESENQQLKVLDLPAQFLTQIGITHPYPFGMILNYDAI